MDRDLAHLHDILDSAELAVDHLGTMTFEEFRGDTLVQDAIIRRFAIMGEAAARILKSSDQTDWPDLPMVKMLDMRNFIVHEYDAIDFHEIYQAIHEQLPAIVSAIRKRIDEIESRKD